MSSFSDIPKPPKARDRGRFAASLKLETVTPILGGGTRTRDIDHVTPVRASTVRGHFRMWWRATRRELPTRNGALDADALYAAERALWGGAGGEGDGGDGKSLVRVGIREVEGAADDHSDVSYRTDGFYALWPAQSQKEDLRRNKAAVPPAPRWRPGLRFVLEVSAPREHEEEVRDAVRAWLLFGGYGGRTRRGLGALGLVAEADREAWLPSEPTPDSVVALLPGLSLGRRAASRSFDLPWLQGAALGLGTAKSGNRGGEQAALTALGWLNDFRQGQPAHGLLGDYDPHHARVRGEGFRASISNWPEADKWRRAQRGRWTHPPRHGADPAWPRAAFGLPIQVQFQRQNRQKGGPRYDEPDNFSLLWQGGAALRDRLASPLIVGPMQLRDGRFAPFALWLNRAYPAGSNVVPVLSGTAWDAFAAPFDKLLGDGDAAFFQPLDAARSEPAGFRLRSAFMDWLQATARASGVVR